VAIRTVTMCASVKPEQKAWVYKVAKKKGVPVSELIREAIDDYQVKLKAA
jgi:hypothetical protein